MGDKIKVSVIIPFYNVEEYFEDCLNSVENQTLSGIEIILINDGSNDSSTQIARKFALDHENVILIEQNNSGQGSARNKGLDVARGEYIYFLDSDDLIENNALLELYDISENLNVELCMFNGDAFFDKSIKDITFSAKYIKEFSYEGVLKGEKLFYTLMENNEYSCSPCLLFIKKSFLDDINLRFIEGDIHEDELFTFMLILQANSTVMHKKILFHRRIRNNSTMTGKNFNKSFDGYYRVFLSMIEFVQSTNKNIGNRTQYQIYRKIGFIYGSSLNRYCKMNKIEKKKSKDKIDKLVKTAKKYKRFGRWEYILFEISPSIYCISRSVYDKIFK